MLRPSAIAIKTLAFLKFFRFQNHHNFLIVIVGSVFFSSQLSLSVFEDLLVQYITFGMLLYGGIYTFNGITDAKGDLEHPRKRGRPIPSGVISKPEAALWMILLWISAFSLSYIYEQSFRYWPIYIAFIAVNLFYSLYLRGTAYRYLIGITCPMRLYLGVSLVGAEATWIDYGIAFFFMCGVQALKIQFESSQTHAWYHSPIYYLLLGSGILFLLQPPDSDKLLFFIALFTHFLFLIIPCLFPQAGVYLLAADVPASKKPPLFVSNALSLLNR